MCLTCRIFQTDILTHKLIESCYKKWSHEGNEEYTPVNTTTLYLSLVTNMPSFRCLATPKPKHEQVNFKTSEGSPPLTELTRASLA